MHIETPLKTDSKSKIKIADEKSKKQTSSVKRQRVDTCMENRLKEDYIKCIKYMKRKPKMIRSYKPDPSQLYIIDTGLDKLNRQLEIEEELKSLRSSNTHAQSSYVNFYNSFS